MIMLCMFRMFRTTKITRRLIIQSFTLAQTPQYNNEEPKQGKSQIPGNQNKENHKYQSTRLVPVQFRLNLIELIKIVVSF